MKILLCCIARLENSYIREFINYYKNIGVTNICLYDNNMDGEEDFNDIISDYINDNFVILKNYRNKKVCQMDAYNECYLEYGDKYDWIMFFDIDEFLTFGNSKYKNLSEYLSESFLENYDIIHLNWLLYGDNEKLHYENDWVLNRFTNHIDLDTKVAYKEIPENCHIKSIIRGGLKDLSFNGNPHTPNNRIFKCCNDIGDEIESRSPFSLMSYKNLYLRHFSTKTIDEYCDKMKRGFPDRVWDGSMISNLLETRFFRTNTITEEKINIIKEKLGIDMSYLLCKPYEGIKNDDIKIFSLCYDKKNFNFLEDEVITPLQVGASNGKDVCNLKDNTGDNISDKNYFYIENTGTYWIWKNIKAKYKGQMQYRRPLNGVNSSMDFEEIFSKYDVITCIPFNHPENSKPTKDNPMFIPAKTVEEGYIFSNCKDDIAILEMIINVYYPEYKESYKKYIKQGENLYYSNGFIMKSEDYDRYCEFLFGCLEKYQNFVDTSSFEKLLERVVTNMSLGKYPKHINPKTRTNEAIRWQTSIGGFLSERIWTLWLLHNFKDDKILKLPYIKMEKNMYT